MLFDSDVEVKVGLCAGADATFVSSRAWRGASLFTTRVPDARN